MALVAVAAYSYYKSRSKKEQTSEEEQENLNQSNDNNHTLLDSSHDSDDTQQPQTSESYYSSWKEQVQENKRFQKLKQGSSFLYQTAIRPCAGIDETNIVGRTRSTKGMTELFATSMAASQHRYNDNGHDESTKINEAGNDSSIKQSFMRPTKGPSSVFLPNIRKEWMEAVFGRHPYQGNLVETDDGSSGTVVEHGTGLAGIDYYTINKTTIQSFKNTASPTNNNSNNAKVGVTVSRIPLGLYVRYIEPGSEAELVGIQKYSILVSINGCLNMLAEPSQSALERLWQYEGHFVNASADSAAATSVAAGDGQFQHPPATTSYTRTTSNTNVTGSNNCSNDVTDILIREPVSLTFIKDGCLYTVLMLCNPPWGIQWAPACNHALVKRSYGEASKAGVLRGSLILSVNNVDYNDHAETAIRIRDLYLSGQTIHLQCGFPPSKSRTGYYERKRQQQAMKSSSRQTDQQTSSSTAKEKISIQQEQLKDQKKHRSRDLVRKSVDGVEIKFLPLEYAIGSLCYPSDSVRYQRSANTLPKSSLLEQYAEQVASGLVEAPTSGMFNIDLKYRAKSETKDPSSGEGKHYKPCPSLLTTSVKDVSNNNFNNAQNFCRQHSDLLEQWSPYEALLYCVNFHQSLYNEATFVQKYAQKAPLANPIESLHSLSSQPFGADVVSTFLLQFVSLICCSTPSTNSFHCSPSNDTDEKKIEAIDEKEGNTCTASYRNSQRSSPCYKNAATSLTSLLLKLSRCNEEFCHRLYFLLRSYIATFETTKTAIPTDNDCSTNSNLSALLYCLELLRFAENELAGRVIHDKAEPPWISGRHKVAHRHIEATQISTSNRTTKDKSCSNHDLLTTGKSKQSVLGFLRKKIGHPHQNDNRSSALDSSFISTASLTLKRTEFLASEGSFTSQPGILSSTSESRTSSSSSVLLQQSPSSMYENMSDFLSELDKICGTIERTLQKSIRQKIADWALQPWSAGKDAALVEVTNNMRSSLREVSEAATSRRNKTPSMLLVNPVESSELLSSIDYDECYILPSAHFPILLTFNVSERRSSSDSVSGEERIYRTRIQLRSLRGLIPADLNSFVVQVCVAGVIGESGSSVCIRNSGGSHHIWKEENELFFETRSAWGAPQTLSIRVFGHIDTYNKANSDLGFCWLDLSEQWEQNNEVAKGSAVCTKEILADVWPLELADSIFDENGDIPTLMTNSKNGTKTQLEIIVTTEIIEFDDTINRGNELHLGRKRMLLYKHDDDLRQEAFAVQFIRTCDEILKASGLDMKLLTFECVPVGARRGFVEWVPGSVPLSELCRSAPTAAAASSIASGMFGSGATSTNQENMASDSDDCEDNENNDSSNQMGRFSIYESLRKSGWNPYNEKLRRIGATGIRAGTCSIINDPIQDYLRSVAFDPCAPYLIRKDVMDTYVKSCAGYSIITYILGVGDRHLDNLLLHHTGAFFHCDYSFILGRDPKTFLPMRITENMIDGMGGKDSDNFAKFLSLAGAAFLVFRRPENVRVLLSMVRLMKASCLPDVSENQSIDLALMGIRRRLQLELSNELDALEYLEALVEASLSNKLWLAVDVIHNLGKQF